MESHATEGLAVARIDEQTCIGCTLCIAACPVDAIVGATKLMHTVLADRCTGCALCLPPCPVDCISLLTRTRPWTAADASRAQVHAATRALRLGPGTSHQARGNTPADERLARSRRREAVAAALVRARARRAARRQTAPRA